MNQWMRHLRTAEASWTTKDKVKISQLGEPFHSEYLILLGARLRIRAIHEKDQYLIFKTIRLFGNFLSKSAQKLETWAARNSENGGAENWNWYVMCFLIKTVIKFKSCSEQEAKKSEEAFEKQSRDCSLSRMQKAGKNVTDAKHTR